MYASRNKHYQCNQKNKYLWFSIRGPQFETYQESWWSFTSKFLTISFLFHIFPNWEKAKIFASLWDQLSTRKLFQHSFSKKHKLPKRRQKHQWNDSPRVPSGPLESLREIWGFFYAHIHLSGNGPSFTTFPFGLKSSRFSRAMSISGMLTMFT